MKKTVIFDLDDTLCNYTQAARLAQQQLNCILEEHSLPVQDFWQDYAALEPLLFEQFVEHSITENEFRVGRFEAVLEKYLPEPTELAVRMNRTYMRATTCNVELFDDVMPVLEELAAHKIPAVILTNGPTDGQSLKYLSLGLEKMISKLFISEQIGWAKPHRQAFDYVLQDLNCKPHEVIMVGDSLEADIQGAQSAGVTAILLDRWGRHADYTGPKITTLSQLMSILLTEQERVS